MHFATIIVLACLIVVGVVIVVWLKAFSMRRPSKQWPRAAAPPGTVDETSDLAPAEAIPRRSDAYAVRSTKFYIQIPDGRVFPVEFPTDVPVGVLLGELVTDESLKIHPPKPEVWHLYYGSSEQKLDLSQNLEQNGVTQGEHLWLMAARLSPSISDTSQGKPGGMKRCDNGHYYDPKKHAAGCPYCGAAFDAHDQEVMRTPAERNALDDAPTRPLGVSVAPRSPRVRAAAPAQRSSAALTFPNPRDSFRCSVFYPEKVGPEDIGKIIAYLHLETAASMVISEALKRLDLSPANKVRAGSQEVQRPLPPLSTVDVTADVPGLLFDTSRTSMRLWEDMQSVEFRFKPAPGLAGAVCRGWVHYWLEGVILADVEITIYVADDRLPEVFREKLAEANAKPYRLVFPSYSHNDTAVVERIEIYASCLGDEYLQDVKKLRSGQHWNEELHRYIRRADVFQLFWSQQAAMSIYVEQEWRRALKECDFRPDPFFIRPVYWAEKLESVPPELSHLHFARAPLDKC